MLALVVSCLDFIMKPVIDSNIYYAKGTQPWGIVWRTHQMTEAEACAKARWFVQEWLKNGLDAEACVFYRDGSIHKRFNAENCFKPACPNHP